MRGHDLAYIPLTCPTGHQTAVDPRDLSLVNINITTAVNVHIK